MILALSARIGHGEPAGTMHPRPACIRPHSPMALTRSAHRLDLSLAGTVGDPIERESLLALSQRKLNALGVPVAYVDRNQRYRFANKAFLEWLGRREHEVLGREIIEVVGRDIFQLYRAYIDAALGGERTGYERQLVSSGRPPMWIRQGMAWTMPLVPRCIRPRQARRGSPARGE